MTFYDINDELIRQDDYARSDEISDHIKNAFIAVEDKRFYRHNGLDVKRIIGAMVEDVKSASFRQGGSTITCQLAKNTHLTNEKSLKRKIQEAKIALQIEKEYTKDEILEMYLNVIYFGNGIYGIKSASKAYFDKSTDSVDPREAATLAAIVSNPTLYSPKNNLTNNQRRAEMILELMMEQGYLTEDDFNESKNTKIMLNYGNFYNNCSSHYINSALCEIRDIGFELKGRQNYKVYTSLDPQAESIARSAIQTYSDTIDSPFSAEIILTDNQSAGVLAHIVLNEKESRKRQPGSLLKPFIYATAIEEGNIIPASPLEDTPTAFGQYQPDNYKRAYHGWIDAQYALSHSLNVPAVALLKSTGIEKVHNKIINAGIPLSERDKTLSLALGGTTYGSSTAELCAGYMTLASYGVQKRPSYIRKITDRTGNVLYRKDSHNKIVFSQESAFLTTSMLLDCAKHGTAKQLSVLPYEVAAKTGTVAAKDQGNTDAWCAAYTTEHTIVCRFSNTNIAHPLSDKVSGGNQPTKTVRSVIKSLYKDDPPRAFFTPSSIKTIEIDTTIKTEMHKLIPYKAHEFGNREKILTISAYHFDEINPDDLFFADLTITPTENGAYIQCKEADGIDYAAYLNGKICQRTTRGFYAEREFFPLGKLELVCKKSGRIIYQKTKIIRIGQSLITSTAPSAASINAS